MNKFNKFSLFLEERYNFLKIKFNSQDFKNLPLSDFLKKHHLDEYSPIHHPNEFIEHILPLLHQSKSKNILSRPKRQNIIQDPKNKETWLLKNLDTKQKFYFFETILSQYDLNEDTIQDLELS